MAFLVRRPPVDSPCSVGPGGSLKLQTLSPDGEPLPSSLALAPLHALRLRAPPQALPTPCTFCQACSLHWRRQLRTTWPPCHHRAAHPSPRSSQPSAAQPAQKPVLDLLGRPAPPATKAKSARASLPPLRFSTEVPGPGVPTHCTPEPPSTPAPCPSLQAISSARGTRVPMPPHPCTSSAEPGRHQSPPGPTCPGHSSRQGNPQSTL